MKLSTKIITLFCIIVIFIIPSNLFSQDKDTHKPVKKVSNNNSETIYKYNGDNNLIKEITTKYSMYNKAKKEYNCVYKHTIEYKYNIDNMLINEAHIESYKYNEYLYGYYNEKTYKNINYKYDDKGRLAEENKENKYYSDYYKELGYNETQYSLSKTKTTYKYNKNDKLIEELSTTDSYSLNGVKSTTNTFKTTYEYNEAGLVISKRDSKNGGGETEYKYNKNKQLISSYYLHGFGSTSISYEYNEDGLLIMETIFSEVEMGASESEINYEYDSNNLLIKETEIILSYALGDKENARKTIVENIYYYN